MFASNILATSATAAHAAPPHLDGLMLFGFLAMFATIVCALTPHASRGKLLLFGACLIACSAYGFLQGAWPLGIVESVWAGASLRRWYVEGTLRKQDTLSSQAREANMSNEKVLHRIDN